MLLLKRTIHEIVQQKAPKHFKMRLSTVPSQLYQNLAAVEIHLHHPKCAFHTSEEDNNYSLSFIKQ